MRCAKTVQMRKTSPQMCVRLGALTVGVEVQRHATFGKVQVHPCRSTIPRRNPNHRRPCQREASLKRLWTPAQLKRMQNTLVREGPFRSSSGVVVQMVKGNWQSDRHSQDRQGGSRSWVSALASQRPQRMQRSFLLFSSPFLCPCLWALFDRQKNQRVQVDTQLLQTSPRLAPPLLSSLARIEFTFPPYLHGATCLRMLSAMQSPARRLVTKNFWFRTNRQTRSHSERQQSSVWREICASGWRCHRGWADRSNRASS